MNKCVECNKEVGNYVTVGNLNVCFTCFFDDSIPNAVSSMEKNREQLEKKKKIAIEKRVAALIKKHESQGE